MAEDTVEAIVQFVRRKLSEYKYLHVEWFGGEPLIEKKNVTKLSVGLLSLCKEFRKPYFSSMTTNGYNLDGETFKLMFSNKVTSYQITLDGLNSTHDKYRPFVSGKGTFDVILKNLKRIRDEEKSQFINVTIRCNITRPILNHFDEYVDMLEKEFGYDRRFGIFWKIAWNPTPEIENDEYCDNGTLEMLLKKYQNRKISFKTISNQFMKNGLVCYAGNPNSFVIRSDGTIVKCTVDFENEINNLGILKKDKIIMLDQKKLSYCQLLWIEKEADFHQAASFSSPSTKTISLATSPSFLKPLSRLQLFSA